MWSHFHIKRVPLAPGMRMDCRWACVETRGLVGGCAVVQQGEDEAQSVVAAVEVLRSDLDLEAKKSYFHTYENAPVE